jgi:hypothetical protein
MGIMVLMFVSTFLGLILVGVIRNATTPPEDKVFNLYQETIVFESISMEKTYLSDNYTVYQKGSDNQMNVIEFKIDKRNNRFISDGAYETLIAKIEFEIKENGEANQYIIDYKKNASIFDINYQNKITIILDKNTVIKEISRNAK